jgi:hypothetical protein
MYLGPRQHGVDPRQAVVRRPRRKQPRHRFRWELVGMLLVVMGAAWFLRNAEPVVTWRELCRSWAIHDVDAFSRLGVLGIALCGAAMIWRILRKGKDPEGDE